MAQLPPLTALRAFEAVARLGVAGASAELNVTPAAISHQVRVLEADLGLTLFARTKRGLELNKAGREYLYAVAGGLKLISDGTRRLMNPYRTQRLVVDSLTSFANAFIVPRLVNFYREHPDVELEIRTLLPGYNRVDFERSGAHVAIRGGAAAGEWPHLKAERLAHEVYFPVCAPQLLSGGNAIVAPSDLANRTLLVVTTTPEGWNEWLAAATAEGHDVTGVDLRNSLRFDTIYSAMIAAISGVGIDLGRSPLVDHAIAQGSLVAPFDLKAMSTNAYWMLYPEGSLELPAFRSFRQWLFHELEAAGAV
jgi:LysR family glycine cleavage system transcriptional activator